ncbi:MAG: AmmeMemoRadiSam system protein B [Myxococcota bacterium]|nr:AmmeMemoRadiSam system protein B [Myxococcota bacterium]
MLKPMQARPPAVAGFFYPSDPEALQRSVREYLEAAGMPLGENRHASAPDAGSRPPKAVIVPHAGYAYSGPVAARVYARLRALRGRVRCVLLLGPAHRVYVRGLAAPSSERFATPLGGLPVDPEALRAVSDLPQVQVSDEAHALEHSLEVQLPFVEEVLGQVAIVPFAVGVATDDEVAEVLERLWGGDETLIVVSSDLSHYLPYETARRVDARTARAIEQLDAEGLDEDSACGRIPIRGLLVAARRHGLAPRIVDLRSSGDTAGPRSEVVGYGGWLFA